MATVGGKLRTVAIDLTPVLPGGENGGAKHFTLALIEAMAKLAPTIDFILLTQSGSHDEMARLERKNVRRHLTLDLVAAAPMAGLMKRVAARLLPHLPKRVAGRAAAVGYWLNAALRRGQSPRVLSGLGVDLLFCPFTAPTYAEPGIPTVSTIYDLQYRTFPEFFSPTERAGRDRTFLMAAKNATLLAAISEYSRQSAIAHGGLDPERIRTIYLRMALRGRLPEPASTILADNGLEPGNYIIYPANFWKHKNHEMLVVAFGMARKAGLARDIKLVLTGAPGERQAWLQQAVSAMSMSDAVRFMGYVSNDDLAHILASSAGLVFPSLYEGFGLPLAEAMAAGVPVACSNVTSLPEVAAGAALLFNPRVPAEIANALTRLVGDKRLRAHLIEAGLRRSELFQSEEQMAQEYLECFADAKGMDHRKSYLAGYYLDGWAGPQMDITSPALSGAGRLEVEFHLPAWFIHKRVAVWTRRSDGQCSGRVNMKAGETFLWTESLGQDPVTVSFHIGPFYVPRDHGHSDDSRELAIQVRRAEFISDANLALSLLPE